MYIIRAIKAHSDEFVDLGKFRSNKIAKETIVKLANEMMADLPAGDDIKIYMGIHSFVHTPKGMSPIIYYITVD
jgi:hypothetical protein